MMQDSGINRCKTLHLMFASKLGLLAAPRNDLDHSHCFLWCAPALRDRFRADMELLLSPVRHDC